MARLPPAPMMARASASASCSSAWAAIAIRCWGVRVPRRARRGQGRQVVDQGVELEEHRPGVRLVDEQQVQHRRHLQVGQVPPAVGHAAVGHLEDGLQQRRLALVDEGAMDEEDQGRRPFHAAAHVEEPPGLPAGHALGGQAGEGGQRQHGPVEAGGLGAVGADPGRGTPGRGAPPGGASSSSSRAVNTRQVSAERRSRTVRATRSTFWMTAARLPSWRSKSRARSCSSVMEAAAGGKAAGPPPTSKGAGAPIARSVWAASAPTRSCNPELCQRPLLGRGVPQARHRDPGQAGDRLGPLGVAAQPVQVVGHPARQVAASPRQLHRVAGGRQQAERAGGPRGEHPGVLAAGAHLHRHLGVVGRARHPGQGARHHGVAAPRGHRVGPQHQRARGPDFPRTAAGWWRLASAPGPPTRAGWPARAPAGSRARRPTARSRTPGG